MMYTTANRALGSIQPGFTLDGSLELLPLLGLIALAPLLLMTLTSFLKMAVVLSIVRSALGTPQIPPNTAITGLALLLTLVVMAPVGEAGWEAFRAAPAPADLRASMARLASAIEPLRGFLAHHARPEDRRAFLEIAGRLRSGTARAHVMDEESFFVLAPAFMVSELRRAFTIGFLLFLPFLTVDLLVGNVLLALGLTQLSPTSFSIPFKLLLFVAVDGWSLLIRGLTAGYQP